MTPRWLAIAILCIGCSKTPAAGPGERLVELPNGGRVVAEVLTRPDDMARGMMYRDQLPVGRGLLFIHGQQGRYPYWMHNVKVPLDIVWLDSARRVVEISPNTPGCDGRPPEQCPSYGGRRPSQFVLELAGGEASRLGIAEGMVLSF